MQLENNLKSNITLLGIVVLSVISNNMTVICFHKWFISIFLIFLWCSNGRSARILGVSIAEMKSHQNLMHKLMKELVLRGHDVTFINSFQHTHPIKNLREILVDEHFEESTSKNFLQQFLNKFFT